MHAFLIIGNNQNNINLKIEELVLKCNATPIEFPLVKINDVRALIKFLSLSLIKPTLVIIRDINLATSEALNAFLKNLEEPQNNLYFVLTAKSKQNVLPTIVSRCQVISVMNKIQESESLETESIFINSLTDNFKYFDKTKKRDEAVILIKDLIQYCHTKMHQDVKIAFWSNMAQLSQHTLINLQANGNVNLHLSLLAINIKNYKGIEI
jgi:hypothetical protein